MVVEEEGVVVVIVVIIVVVVVAVDTIRPLTTWGTTPTQNTHHRRSYTTRGAAPSPDTHPTRTKTWKELARGRKFRVGTCYLLTADHWLPSVAGWPLASWPLGCSLFTAHCLQIISKLKEELQDVRSKSSIETKYMQKEVR